MRRQDLDEIMDTITTASGVEVLPCSKWKLFVESIRDPMQRFVGKAIERFFYLKITIDTKQILKINNEYFDYENNFNKF